MADVEQPIEVDPNPSPSLYLSTEEKLAQATKEVEAQYWINMVVNEAKNEQKPWYDECRSAWREFQGQKLDGTWRPTKLWWCEVFPRYWSDTELMQPALYSRTPKAVSRRKFDSKDPIARTGCVINDRLAQWLMATGDYDRTMEMSALGYLNTSRQTCRVFFQDKLVTRKERKYLVPSIGENGEEILVDEQQNALPDDVGVQTDEDGRPFYELDSDEQVSRPRIVSKPVQFDKLRISPGARNESEIWWIAYEITCTKKEAAQMFGEKVDVKNIPDPNPPTTSSSDYDQTNDNKKTQDLFTYWEVWNKRDKKVYWMHEGYKQGFLKEEDDIYGLEEFFPSPKFMMDNMRYDSMYPVPDYTQCKDSYEQCHILYKRINHVIRASKAGILYDGNEADLTNFFRETTDNEGIGMSKWAETQAEGGLESKMFIPNYAPFANLLQQLNAAFAAQKLNIDELRGITDLMRAVSDPSTSATAEKLKDRRSSLRFAKKKKAMLVFAVETLQMMLDLAYKTFEEDYIKDITGFNQMEPSDQANFQSALALLRNDEERVIRIDIETDSMVLFDDMDRKEQSIEALDKIGSYVQNIGQANPLLLPPLVILLGQVVRSMDDSKDAEDPIAQAFQQLVEQSQQPPQPPQPNPDLIAKLNADGQKANAEIQSRERIEMQKLQFQYGKLNQDGSLKQAELGIKGADLQLKGATIQQDGMAKQGDLAIKADSNNIQREWMALDAQGQVTQAQLKSNDQMLQMQDLGIRAQDVQAKTTIEGARLQIEQALASLKQWEVQLSEQEKYMTEQRLQQEFEHTRESDTHAKDIEATQVLAEVETIKAQEATKQVEAMASTREAPAVQVIIPERAPRKTTTTKTT